ncbi:hypothetical protein [Streptococcus uberis]|uniref:rolling circle replication-associated protein n=1 Tax=Streptococcus uberis TaxID=1349 RepID=UPI0012B54793|nr:hypothetical protein [Streptococcus uberis]MTB36803.1 hypothetical protein [Streptococcus uberis]MTB57785.1 hypothetical protein [Streptococcus uberis]
MNNTENSLNEIYNKKTVDYGNGNIDIIIYSEPQVRVLESSNHKGGANKLSEISDKAQEQRTKSQSYAIKRKIRGYGLANNFKWFVTLTIDPKKYESKDYEKTKKLLLNWCRNMRDKYGKFDYLLIPEFHKSKAIHFHGLLSDIPALFEPATHPKTNKNLERNGRQIYNLKDWKFGFSDCEVIIDRERTASYITKYITKELLSNKKMFRKKRYFVSKGLKKPKINFTNADIKELDKFIPNFGIVATNSKGENILEKAIYRLESDTLNGCLIQNNKDYLIKAKSHHPMISTPSDDDNSFFEE